MKRSTNQILTTHVGSLPRPKDLLERLAASETGETVDREALEVRISRAIDEIVKRQRDCGLDIVNDGENSKTSYTLYIQDRLEGVGPVPAGSERPASARHADLAAHPDLMDILARRLSGLSWFDRVQPPVCLGPVSYRNLEPLDRDIGNLKAALKHHGVEEAFMSSASPGVLTKFVPNMYYDSEQDYLEALAEALRVEYEAIAAAGIVLHIDAPDLASARHNQYQNLDDDAFLKIAARNIEALNHATRNIEPERMRMHVCWGNYEGPHTHDISLAKLLPVLIRARPAGLLIEGANPAHAHEWEDLAQHGLPDDKILIPGVIDTTTNFVENPQLVAQRIVQWAKVVGRERVIASTDCGFATFAGPNNPVAPSVVWQKLSSLSEGARRATQLLW